VKSRTWLTGPYVACELIANTTAGKPMMLPGGILKLAAVLICALTFTLVDLINERLGETDAQQVICVAFVANLLLVAYAHLAVQLSVSLIGVPPIYAVRREKERVAG